jgi:hypothetical protein
MEVASVWKVTAIVLIALGILGAVIYSQADSLAPPSLNPELDRLNIQNVKLRLQLAKERETNHRVQAKLRKEVRNLRRVARDVRYPTPAGNKRLARAFFGNDYNAAAEIINGETAGTWDHTIWNYEGSGAYGLGQARPRSKMLAYGADAYTNPLTQMVWFKAYAEARYNSVQGAAAHWTPNRSW